MSAIGAAIGAACEEALKPLQVELREQKASQHAAIDLFKDRLGELRRLVEDQGRRMKALEDENATLRNARHPSLSPADKLHSLSEDLEELRQTLTSSLTSLRDDVGTLRNDHENLRTRLGLIAEKHEQSLSSAGYGRHSVDGLTQLRNQSAHQINSLTLEQATLVQALNNQSNELARMQQAIAQLSNLAGRRDYGHMIGALRNAVGELRNASHAHSRSITMLTSAQSARSPITGPAQTQNTQLERHVHDLGRHRLEHTSRLVSLENWRATWLRNQEQQPAHLNRHDDALVLLENEISKINATLENTALQANEVQAELLKVTRTLLGVIKVMKNREQSRTSEMPGSQVKSPTSVSQLQEQVEATLSARQKAVATPSREVIILDDDAAAASHDAAQGDSTASAVSTGAEQDDGTTLVDSAQALTEDRREEMNGGDSGVIAHVECSGPQPRDDETKDQTDKESKTKRQEPEARDGYCHSCGRTQSSRWLGGPNGTRTLCNTCGAKWSKVKKGLSGDTRQEAGRAFTAAVRESSASATSAFASRDGRENRSQQTGGRGLKRKPTLSPLQEHFETDSHDDAAISPHSTQNRTSLAPEIPTIRLARTGYTLVTAPNSDDASLRSASSRSGGKLANMQQNAPDEQSASSKRKRMNADGKARMFANEFVADSGSRSGQKRRRTALNKIVRFELEDDLSDVQEDEAEDSAASATRSVEKAGDQAERQSTSFTNSVSLIASNNDATSSERGTTSTTKQTKPQGRGPKKASSNAKSNAADDVRSSARYRAPNMRKPQKPVQTPVVEEDLLNASSEDNIVVARPSRPVSVQDPEPPAAATTADIANSYTEPAELERTPQDALGSEDELALPTRPLRNKCHPSPSYTAASVRAMAPGGQTYRSLLSQFNIGRDARVEDQVVVPSIEKSESEMTTRPKRAPKPRQLLDVVDGRSLTEEQLGE